MSSNIMNSKKKRLNLSRSNKSPKTTPEFKKVHRINFYPELLDFLPSGAVCIFGYISTFLFDPKTNRRKPDNSKYWASSEVIGQVLRISEGTVNNNFVRLRKAGLITTYRKWAWGKDGRFAELTEKGEKYAKVRSLKSDVTSKVRSLKSDVTPKVTSRKNDVTSKVRSLKSDVHIIDKVKSIDKVKDDVDVREEKTKSSTSFSSLRVVPNQEKKKRVPLEETECIVLIKANWNERVLVKRKVRGKEPPPDVYTPRQEEQFSKSARRLLESDEFDDILNIRVQDKVDYMFEALATCKFAPLTIGNLCSDDLFDTALVQYMNKLVGREARQRAVGRYDPQPKDFVVECVGPNPN